MKQFFSFVKKEFYHIFRDRRTMFILLGMPIIQIVIFGFALTNEVKNSKFAVLNLAQDETSRQLIQQLDASAYFDQQDHLHSAKEIESVFKKGKVKLVVVIAPNFGNDLRHINTAQVQLIADASDPNVANTLVNYATAIIHDFQTNLNQHTKLPYTILTEQRMLYNGDGFIVGLYHDDCNNYCTRKGDRNDGNYVSVAASAHYDCGSKSSSVFIVVDGKYCQYFIVKRICFGCTHKRKFTFVGSRKYLVYTGVAFVRLVDFCGSGFSANSHVYLLNWHVFANGYV
jgi:ABC-2 family transporter protein